ncbi:MAG: hypothetical protein NC417_14250 [Candidatus Gastranaerophilales bacterium]|nr:hypothetical protein [Candidatus Gastranaerophilales bacterium]
MENKKFYKECLKTEVYRGAVGCSPKQICRRLYYKYLCPTSNAVYLFRKMQYMHSKNSLLGKFRCILLRKKLAQKYGILASPLAQIDIGLSFPHPTSIVIGRCVTAGRNLSLYQNTTLGGARIGDFSAGNQPTLGNDVIVFANSAILGKVTVGDNVTVGANSLLLSDALQEGVYVGSPAVLHSPSPSNS